MALQSHQPPNNFHDLPILDLPSGHRVILDPEDYRRLRHYRWFLKRSRSTVYVVRRERRNQKDRLIRMHRQVTRCPPHLTVHHINGNPLDNRKSNLQLLTPKQHSALPKSR